jgi:hypothetical protein
MSYPYMAHYAAMVVYSCHFHRRERNKFIIACNVARRSELVIRAPPQNRPPLPKISATPQRFPAGHGWHGIRRCG